MHLPPTILVARLKWLYSPAELTHTYLFTMRRPSAIIHKTTTKNVLDLQNLYEHGHLNMEPHFQRQSVWNDRDRTKLIDSILRNYSLPTILHYNREEEGVLVYDVNHTCSHPGCVVKLTWGHFTIDHINLHSKGDHAQLANAALMRRKHNSKKGNRRPLIHA